MPWTMMKREPFSEPETEEEGGQKLTFFQSVRKKGGESGEAGVGGDDFFRAATPLLPASPPFSGPDWENGGANSLQFFQNRRIEIR